jgi:hypothetical protein
MIHNSMRGAASSTEKQSSILFTFLFDISDVFKGLAGIKLDQPIPEQLQQIFLEGNRLLSFGILLLIICVIWLVILSIVYTTTTRRQY